MLNFLLGFLAGANLEMAAIPWQVLVFIVIGSVTITFLIAHLITKKTERDVKAILEKTRRELKNDR